MSTKEDLRWLASNHLGCPERCIKACEWASYSKGVWSCPIFERGVEHVAIETFGGVRCAMFERRLDDRR